jgi:hypothetical protein
MAIKQIRDGGFNQPEVIEMMYYLRDGYTSILNYMSTCGVTLSRLIASLSAQVGSASTTVLSVSGKASFPASITSATGVSITLL